MEPARARRGVVIASLLALALCGVPACSDPAVRVEEHRARGEAALSEGRYPDAILEFKNLLQIAPNDGAAHYGLAQAYLASQKSRQGFWELQETVRLDPDNLDARLRYARLLSFGSEADREEAVAQADAVLAADPGSWTALLLKGRALQALGRDEEARATFEAAVEGSPDESAPLLVLAEFHRGRGEREQAEPLYRKLAERENDSFAWNALAGFLAVDRGRDAEAEAAYRKALEQAGPDQRDGAYTQLANFLSARDRFEEAEALLLQAIESEEDDLELVYALARLYDARGDTGRAEAMLREAADARPGDPRPLLLLSDYRGRHGDLAGALEAAEQALSAGPRDDRARLRKAELLLELGSRESDADRIAQGRAVVEAVLAADPGQPEALYVDARLSITEGQPEEAVAALRRALDRRPDWAAAHALLGRALIELGDGAGARSELARAIELDASQVEAQQSLARLHANLGENELAVEVGRRALERDPEDTRLRLIVAESLLRLGRPDEVMPELERIPESARTAEVYYAMGRMQVASGQLAEARRNLLRADEMDPARFETVAALFELDLREGRLDESAERIYAATVQSPRDARLMQLLGEVALRRGDIEAAESAFRRAIELDPNDVGAYGNLARYMMATGRPDDVLQTFEDAREANPGSGLVNLQLATLYEARGRQADALARYEDAVRLDPGLVVAKNNLAYLLVETGGDLDRALDLAQEAKAALPESPNVADTLGWVLYKKGIPSAAVGYLREAEQGLRPGDSQLGEIRLHLALAYEANAEPEAAREVVARALRDIEATRERAGASAPESPWAAELQAVAERLGPAPAAAPSEEG